MDINWIYSTDGTAVEPETIILYVRKETVWKIYTSKMTDRSTRYDPIYIIQSQLYHTPECKIISSIEHTLEYHVRYQV